MEKYIGNQEINGKSVFEIGTANGFLCFEMERKGAVVTAYDLSKDSEWDIIPFYGKNTAEFRHSWQQHIDKTNNAWWLAHSVFNSKANVVYGSVYDIPDGLGDFDIVTMGSVLLHVRDPFLAMQKASSHAKETIIITEPLSRRFLPLSLTFPGIISAYYSLKMNLAGMTGNKPKVKFLPNHRRADRFHTWWKLPPEVIAEMLRILGFPDISITVHNQRHRTGKIPMYTIVGQR